MRLLCNDLLVSVVEFYVCYRVGAAESEDRCSTGKGMMQTVALQFDRSELVAAQDAWQAPVELLAGGIFVTGARCGSQDGSLNIPSYQVP